MNVNFNNGYSPFSEGTFLNIAYNEPVYNPRVPTLSDINRIKDVIERFRTHYQFYPDEFLSELAQKIDGNSANILIPELKILISKIFWVLDKNPNPVATKNIKKIVRYLLKIYKNGQFPFYAKKLAGQISIFYSEYLFFYLFENYHRFRGDMLRARFGLLNPSSIDRESLVSINQWTFHRGTYVIMRDFRRLLELSLGKIFLQIEKEYENWENSLSRMRDDWQEKLGFKEHEENEQTELNNWPSEDFAKWVDTSRDYIFNENLVSTFTRLFSNCPNIWNYLYSIYDSLNFAEKWIKKGESSRRLMPFITRLDLYSTEGFSTPKKDFNLFFVSLIQFYTWIISHRCAELSLVTDLQPVVPFLTSKEVRQKLENSVESLTASQKYSLKLEFAKYGDVIGYFKDLIYKDAKNPSKEIPDAYNQFSDCLDFILELLESNCEEENASNLFQSGFSESSMSYFYP